MFFKDKVELLKKHAETFKTLAGEGVSSLAATTTESLSAVAGSISEQTTTLSTRTASAMNDAAATGKDVVGKVASSLSSAPDIGSACVSQLAELKGVAVVFVVILRSNVPLKVLDLGSKLPLVGMAGTVGKILLSGLLTKLNDAIIASGEPAIMGQFCQAWQGKGISQEAIVENIRALPGLVIDSDTKDEAVSLVQKYYSQSENTDGSLVLSASAYHQSS